MTCVEDAPGQHQIRAAAAFICSALRNTCVANGSAQRAATHTSTDTWPATGITTLPGQLLPLAAVHGQWLHLQLALTAAAAALALAARQCCHHLGHPVLLVARPAHEGCGMKRPGSVECSGNMCERYWSALKARHSSCSAFTTLPGLHPNQTHTHTCARRRPHKYTHMHPPTSTRTHLRP